MSFGQNIKDVMKHKKMTAKQLADVLDVSRGLVTHWTNNVRTPNPEQIEKILNILSIDANTLFYDEVSPKLNKFIPLIGLASCGVPQEYDLNGYEAVPVDTKMYSDGMYAVQAEGDSMSPKITHGNILYCSPSVQIENGSIVHYKFKDESGIKRYKINGSGTIVSLVPINSDYDIITIDEFEQGMLTIVKVTAIIDTDL